MKLNSGMVGTAASNFIKDHYQLSQSLTYPDFFLADQYINQIHEGTTIVEAERLKHFPNY